MTNTALIEMGLLFPLARGTGVYHCPSDKSVSLRSYSMQPQVASYLTESPTIRNSPMESLSSRPCTTKAKCESFLP